MTEFELDKKKAENALLYIASKIQTGNVADKYKLLKILYFAERKHLAKYGRPITGDSYAKINYGPIPSFCMDLIKTNNIKKPLYTKTKTDIVVGKKPDLDYLSESDIECLNQSIAENKDLDFGALKNKSHDSLHTATQKNAHLSYIDMAKAEGADDRMIEYIKLLSENQTFTFNAPSSK